MWRDRLGGERRPAREPPRGRNLYREGLVLFVAVYASAADALSIPAYSEIYALGLGALVVLTAAVFVANLRSPHPSGQRFYLALSIIPTLTIARLAFADLPILVLDPILVYLLLAVALLTFRETTGARVVLAGRGRAPWARALLLGGGLATGMSIFGFVFLAPGPSSTEVQPWLWAVSLAPVALLDELWFRGLLQRDLTDRTSAPWGWIATAAIFVAYGAPLGTPATLVFRSAYGLVFGALAMRQENVAATLVARIAMTVALVLLIPGLADTSLIV